MRVMIVEDEKRARAVIRNLVLAVDPLIQIVGECANGAEGLEQIPRMLPDLVFVDIRMPGISGLEMIRQLKQKNVQTEYVMITGYSDFRYAKEGIDLGVAGYVLKPVTYEDISAQLSKAASRMTGRTVDPHIREQFPAAQVREVEQNCQNLLVKKAIRYVNDHMGAPCRLAQTARELKISPEHLSRIFHMETGFTFTDYVRYVKIDYAMVLLRKTDRKVQEISWAIGIENDKYFHNIFKETVGMTPKQYRMNGQEEYEGPETEDDTGEDEKPDAQQADEGK